MIRVTFVVFLIVTIFASSLAPQEVFAGQSDTVNIRVTVTPNNITYTYYSSGKIESATLAAPDAYGNVYYHYIDEDWNYQGYGRVDRYIKASGDIVAIEYWPSGNKKREAFFGPSYTWQNTIEYYDNTSNIRHYQWMADPNPAQAGDITYYEYDNLGRLTKKQFDDSSFVLYSYWGTTNNKYRDEFYGTGWLWQYAIEYYEDGVTIHYEWRSDTNPNTPGDNIYNEYDSYGRIENKIFDDGHVIHTAYWDNINNAIKQLDYLDPGWIWTHSIQYYEDGMTCHYEWIADSNPSTSGDVTSRIYDLSGRLTNLGYDSGASEAFVYYGSTSNIYQHSFGDPTGAWQKTIEYWEDGATKHYEWFADPNPAVPGDAVHYEYNSTGAKIKMVLDTGEVFEYDPSDPVPPTGSIVINNNNQYTNTSNVTLTLSATDDVSAVSQMRFSDDNITWTAPEAYATTKSWTLPSGDGQKTVYVKFKDVAGNWSIAYSDAIVLYTTTVTATVIYSYDNLNRLEGMAVGETNTTYTYDEIGNIKNETTERTTP